MFCLLSTSSIVSLLEDWFTLAIFAASTALSRYIPTTTIKIMPVKFHAKRKVSLLTNCKQNYTSHRNHCHHLYVFWRYELIKLIMPQWTCYMFINNRIPSINHMHKLNTCTKFPHHHTINDCSGTIIVFLLFPNKK